MAGTDEMAEAMVRVGGVLSEQHCAARLLARGAKCRQLSALYEREARLWTLLARHTAGPPARLPTTAAAAP